MCLQRSLAPSFKEKWPNTCMLCQTMFQLPATAPAQQNKDCQAESRLSTYSSGVVRHKPSCTDSWVTHSSSCVSQAHITPTFFVTSHESRRVVAVKICHLFIPPLISSDPTWGVRVESRDQKKPPWSALYALITLRAAKQCTKHKSFSSRKRGPASIQISWECSM